MGAPALPPAPRPTEPPPGIAVVRDHSDRVEQGDGSWKWFPGYFLILLPDIALRRFYETRPCVALRRPCLTVRNGGRYAISVVYQQRIPTGRLGGSGVHGGAERTENSMTTVERIVHDDLARFYSKEFEVVARHVRAFLNDEEYVQIYIVFDGKVEELRATNWARGLTGRIREKLSSEHIDEFPILSPVSKSGVPGKTYRALGHNEARSKCKNQKMMQRFPDEINRFADVFCTMQWPMIKRALPSEQTS